MYHRFHDRAAGLTPEMNWHDLPDLFPTFEEPGRWLPLLERHAGLLEAAAEHTRVTSVEPAEAIQRHYAESLEIWRLLRSDAIAPTDFVVDVGSGGGFPGMVAAAVSPERRFALIEPLKKRARLLEHLAGELGLGNVEVHALRAEEAGHGPLRDAAGVVTARAVAQLAELLEYTAPFACDEGVIGLPKGSGLQAELAASAKACHLLGCRLVANERMRQEISRTLSVVVFRKSGRTHKAYPRRPGLPHQKPLA